MQNDYFSIRLLPGVSHISQEHQQAGQQPDNLCGPYWVAILLRSYGISVSPEHIAQHSGTVLPIGEPSTWLPDGAVSRQDYNILLPTTHCLEDAGTSAQGLIHAVGEISADAYTLLPVQTEWTADRLFHLIQLCQDHPHWQAIPLCNLKTGQLWGANLRIADALDYLNGHSISPPAPDWNVGHFLVLAGSITGSVNTLLWLGDTYPHLGWQGYHLQPAAAIAQALNRGDGHGGGILLFIASRDRTQVEQQLQAKAFQIAVWDNGSPHRIVAPTE